MKKKKVLIGVLVLTVLLLVATSYASTPQDAGYEAFKNVIRNHKEGEFHNGTIETAIKIIDNNETVLMVEGELSADENKEAFSGNLEIITDNLEKELSVYGFEKMIYIVDPDSNDVYVGEDDEENNYRNRRKYDEKHEMTSKEEAVLDYFVGDLSNEIELVNLSDGSAEIKLELTKSEMPPILNLLASAHSEDEYYHDEDDDEFCEDFNMEDYPIFKEFHNSNFKLTELEEGIEFELLKLTIRVDQSQQMTGMSFEATVSGMDENSEKHTISINADMNVKDVGSSVIETLDLTGKNIIEMK